MSIARYKRLTRILNTIIIFLACFPVILLVLCALDALSLSWTIIFPIMAFVLSFLLQNYCTNLHVFFLCNRSMPRYRLPSGCLQPGFLHTFRALLSMK